MENQIQAQSVEIPLTIPAAGQDWLNYMAQYTATEDKIQNTLHLVLEFQDQLDVNRMVKAVRHSVDAEPVLGCCFMEDPQQPYWKRMSHLDDIEWCLFEETQNSRNVLQQFVLSPLEPANRQLQAKIIRSQENDILCLKISHSVCDGGGAKEYVHLLMTIYSRLCQNENFLPVPNIAGKRDSSSLFKELGITDIRKAWNPQLAALRPTWAFPYHQGQPSKLQVITKKLDKAQYDAISSHARQKNVTINDVLLTAYYRVLFDILLPDPLEEMEILVTADLRRYLPEKRGESVCNLSGILNARIGRIEDESFDSTLDRVSGMMKQLKKNNPGIHSAVTMELMRGMGFNTALGYINDAREKAVKSGKASPILSNMGELFKYPLQFGNNTVKDAYIVTPPMHPPGFMLGVGTYNNMLTMAVSFYEPATQSEDVQRFLDMLQEELLCATSNECIK